MDSLDKHFRRLTRKAFEAHGFAHGELIANWPAVVGDDIARQCQPDRLKWPRQRDGKKSQEGATLVLRCDPAAGLALAHDTDRIAERVNAFYGYRAVADIKIRQAHNWQPKHPDPRRPGDAPAEVVDKVNESVQRVADEPLRQALSRLGCSLMSVQQGGKHR
jgi:hypothetical protein